MAGLIAYDKPVRDFIAGLDATGHVTHTAYRKDSVTFHHNGGRLSLQGILDVWKTREASAHFQVDGQGNIGQYVRVNEYAWATGTTEGNKSSISIEMANATLSPEWAVAEVTFMEAARLGGWLFAKVIGAPPTHDKVHVHHDWKQTTCAGPFIDKVRAKMFEQVQVAYLYFVGGAGAVRPPSAPAGTQVGPGGVAPDGTPWGSGKPIDVVAREVINGEWGSGQDRINRLRAALYDPDLVQRTVNAIMSGQKLPPAPAPAPARKSIEQIADEVLAGDWGNGTERSRRIQAAGYDYAAVREAVNAKAGVSGPARLSVTAIAQQVIKNQWGSGAERKRRITAAGYDYNAVQAEVNRLLK